MSQCNPQRRMVRAIYFFFPTHWKIEPQLGLISAFIKILILIQS